MSKHTDRKPDPFTKSGNIYDKFFRVTLSTVDKVRNMFTSAFNKLQLEHFDLDSIEILSSDLLDVN